MVFAVFVFVIIWILIAIWPITLTVIGLILLWFFFPRKEFSCYNDELGKYPNSTVCSRKFRRKKNRDRHREICEIRANMFDEKRRRQEEAERQRRKWKQEKEEEEKRQRRKRQREERAWKRQEEEFRRQEKKFYEEWDRIFEELLNKLSTPDIEKYYKILDLKTNVSLEQIKRRYRELVLKYHPDKCKNKKAAEKKFKKIVEAYEMIIRYRKENPDYEETVVESYPTKPTSNV